MRLFLVLLHSPHEELWAKIKKEWPEWHFFTDDCTAWIASDKPNVQEIVDVLGLETHDFGGERSLWTVLKTNNVRGRGSSDFTSWIKKYVNIREERQ